MMELNTENTEKSGEKQRMVFSKKRYARNKYVNNDVTASLKAILPGGDELNISYFDNGTFIVTMYRWNPVPTSMNVHLARPSREGKRKAIAYVMSNMNEVLLDEDVNEELDI